MQLTQSEKIKLVIGALIGAFLGAGTVWSLMKAPADDGAEADPISPKEILTLTGTAAALIRGLADFRRKL